MEQKEYAKYATFISNMKKHIWWKEINVIDNISLQDIFNRPIIDEYTSYNRSLRTIVYML